MGFVVLLLVLANLSLFAGHPNQALMFDGARVAAGEWWRLITYPLVHVSIYHALIDGCTFLALWVLWRPPSLTARLGVLTGCSVGSLLGALAWSPDVWRYGLCGLSGVGHGLMAVVALAQMRGAGRDRVTWSVGMICLAMVVGKSIIETATGFVVFSGMHPGDLGVPIAACHLGGVLGGLAASLCTEGTSWTDIRRIRLEAVA